VGTITEIYDLRLFYARGADAYSYNTGENGFTLDEQIKDLITQDFQENASIFWHQLLEPEKDMAENFPTNCQTRFLKVRQR
jgi:excinuclease ABC subunit A